MINQKNNNSGIALIALILIIVIFVGLTVGGIIIYKNSEICLV